MILIYNCNHKDFKCNVMVDMTAKSKSITLMLTMVILFIRHAHTVLLITDTEVHYFAHHDPISGY